MTASSVDIAPITCFISEAFECAVPQKLAQSCIDLGGQALETAAHQDDCTSPSNASDLHRA
jgi:hypothetical protein